MKLRVGEVVVYGNHGIGRVAARKAQTVLGEQRDVVVIELENDLSVTLPLDLAETQLRPLVGEAELKRIREVLRDDGDLTIGPWLSRRRETLEKLTGGDPVQLAEIVSEGARRERLRLEKGSKPQLSVGEREIFNRARTLLTGEIALARGIQLAAADGWIDEQLAKAV